MSNIVDLGELYCNGEEVEFDTRRVSVELYNSKLVKLNTDFAITKIEKDFLYIKELGTN